MLRPEQRHVRQKSVGRLGFESDAVCSTVARQKLSDTVQRCIRENDRKSHEDLDIFLQQCWTQSQNLPGGCESEASKWELHCEALLALLYLQFCGSKVESNLVQLHRCQFMMKWFSSCDDFLSTGAAVREPQWTQSFVSVVLLYALMTPTCATEVKEFITVFRTRSRPSISQSPAWLQQILAVDDPYSLLVDSLIGILVFQHDLPKVLNDECAASNTLTLLKLFNDYHLHETPSVLLDALDKIIYCEGMCDPAVLGYASWLKGLVAQDNSCFTLAAACYRDAVRSWRHLPLVLFNAFQVYLRSQVVSAALESLRLFVRSCDEAVRYEGYLPYSAAVLRSLLPAPCPAAARALLMVAAVRHKMYSEALDHYKALQNLPAVAGADTARRQLLRHDHLPPPCPAMAALRTQAAIAAARLSRPAVLQEMLASGQHGHIDDVKYYDSNCGEQVVLLSSLLRRVLTASHCLELSRHDAAMRECAGLVDAMTWVLPAIPAGDDFHPLLALTPLLMRALVYSYLSRLHAMSGNDASARRFERLSRQNVLFAMSFLSEGASVVQKESLKFMKRESNDEESDDEMNDDTEQAFSKERYNNLPEKLSKFCENVTQNSRDMDESTAFIVGNIALFAAEALCSSKDDKLFQI